MKRRGFLKTFGTATGSVILLKEGLFAKNPDLFQNTLKTVKNEQKFWELVRKQFLFPDGYTYLNTGGIGATPLPVLDDVARHMKKDQKYPQAGHNKNEWNEIKNKCKMLLGPDCNKEELALTANATEGINIVINGLPLKKGDEIITSTHEHPALHVPLLNRMQYDGITIRSFEPDLKNGLNNVKLINKLINSKTRLIFISHVTCTTGQQLPVKEISELARKHKIWFGLDGAQAVGGIKTNLQDLGVDFYAFSGHKWTLGPKRTGVLFVKKELWDTVRPITVGAYSDGGYDITKRELKFCHDAGRYEYGTQNPSLFSGLKTGVELLEKVGFTKVIAHDHTLAEEFYHRVKSLKKVKVLSPSQEKYRSPLITIKPVNGSGQDLANSLGKKQIRVRYVPEAGLNGVRVSFHLYNCIADVEKIVYNIKTILKE